MIEFITLALTVLCLLDPVIGFWDLLTADLNIYLAQRPSQYILVASNQGLRIIHSQLYRLDQYFFLGGQKLLDIKSRVRNGTVLVAAAPSLSINMNNLKI